MPGVGGFRERLLCLVAASGEPTLPSEWGAAVKVGTTITKMYKGKTINVRVLEQGFEYQDKQFRSLSAVAKHVTGSIWNGYLFFGLIKRGSKKS